jgi:hypothetical protein
MKTTNNDHAKPEKRQDKEESHQDIGQHHHHEENVRHKLKYKGNTK